MTVRELPMNESFSTCVSLEPRNGVWSCSWYSARMHSLSASKLLLISAPSSLRAQQVVVRSRVVLNDVLGLPPHLVWRSL